jgi:hypothetical protein
MKALLGEDFSIEVLDGKTALSRLLDDSALQYNQLNDQDDDNAVIVCAEEQSQAQVIDEFGKFSGSVFGSLSSLWSWFQYFLRANSLIDGLYSMFVSIRFCTFVSNEHVTFIISASVRTAQVGLN